MQVKLLPYTLVDGICTLRDSEILELIDRAERDGSKSDIFFGDPEYTKLDFLNKVKSEPNNLLLKVLVDSKDAGFIFLDNIRFKHAFGHFCFFKEFWGRGGVIGREIIRQLRETFECIIGVTPIENRRAQVALQIAGMEMQCIISGYYYDYQNNKPVSGVMYTTTQKEI